MTLGRLASFIFVALALTIALEGVMAFIMGVRNIRGQITILLVNIITNPALNCLLLILSLSISPKMNYYAIIPLEIIIVFVEGLIYKKMLKTKLNSFLFSLILNAFSFVVGLIISISIHVF